MYSGSSDGESHEASQRNILPASSMLWARNLRRYIGAGAGLGPEALMELETKRILLDIFKEKQQKTAEAGTIPTFYKKKQSELLLNADDLSAMWVCLRENGVIDDATGAEKVSLMQARIDMSELDEDSDGFLQTHEMEAYIQGLIPNLAKRRDMPAAFVQMYCRIVAHKFLFFCDPHRRGLKACIKKVLLSNCLQELMELHQICFLSKQELPEYADGTLTDILIERVFDEHVCRGKIGGGNAREMDVESFLDFVLALEKKDTPEGLTYLFKCLDLHGRGFLTTADIHSLFRDVYQKWIEGGNYELYIEDVRDEIWDMVKPADL